MDCKEITSRAGELYQQIESAMLHHPTGLAHLVRKELGAHWPNEQYRDLRRISLLRNTIDASSVMHLLYLTRVPIEYSAQKISEMDFRLDVLLEQEIAKTPQNAVEYISCVERQKHKTYSGEEYRIIGKPDTDCGLTLYTGAGSQTIFTRVDNTYGNKKMEERYNLTTGTVTIIVNEARQHRRDMLPQDHPAMESFLEGFEWWIMNNIHLLLCTGKPQ